MTSPKDKCAKVKYTADHAVRHLHPLTRESEDVKDSSQIPDLDIEADAVRDHMIRLTASAEACSAAS
ncbi:MAG TPA: hypothetical protein VEM40_14240 [Nitrospirota bacterium]|nr:hypothetical protein [Nitrospirota bacterium]